MTGRDSGEVVVFWNDSIREFNEKKFCNNAKSSPVILRSNASSGSYQLESAFSGIGVSDCKLSGMGFNGEKLQRLCFLKNHDNSGVPHWQDSETSWISCSHSPSSFISKTLRFFAFRRTVALSGSFGIASTPPCGNPLVQNDSIREFNCGCLLKNAGLIHSYTI